MDLAADLCDMALVPGTYTADAAIGMTCRLTLEANGVSKPEWTFNIGGAFTAAASSEMVGVGTDANVKWVVNGAITLGAKSLAIGDMKATGAITMGAGATCGNLDSDAAIGTGEGATSGNLVAVGAITVGAKSGCGNADSKAAITLGADATCGDLVAVGAITLGAGSTSGHIDAGGAITVGEGAVYLSATSGIDASIP
jgi:hypothetical protein